MLVEQLRDGAWSCFTEDGTSLSVLSITELLDTIDGFSVTLKDDRRSLVKKGQLIGRSVVAKQPRDKNRRQWARILSFFFPAEARKTFITLTEFKRKGIDSLTPLCVLEKRRSGMVVDSWLLYEFRDGVRSDATSLPEIVKQLTHLHQQGYRHDDPNFGNFMVAPNGDMFLIDCKGKSRVGNFSDYYDFMLLRERNKGLTAGQVDELVTMNTLSFGYYLAVLYSGYKTTRTVIKKKLGKKRTKDS